MAMDGSLFLSSSNNAFKITCQQDVECTDMLGIPKKLGVVEINIHHGWRIMSVGKWFVECNR